MPQPHPLRAIVRLACGLTLGLAAFASVRFAEAADEAPSEAESKTAAVAATPREPLDDAAIQKARELAAKRKKFDWTEWRKLPVLDKGRVKPLDTLAEETVTLVTARSVWTDPETGVKYRAPELLFAWIADPEAWLSRPVVRCEFRPLRSLLKTDATPIEVEGAYVSVRDVLDWDRSKREGHPVYWSKDVEERMKAIDSASRQKKSPETVGDTADDKALNGKLAELFGHLQAFLNVREARRIFVAPGLDPRVLTLQTNPDDSIPAWVSLGGLLRAEDWRKEGDVTVAAVMARDPRELLEVLVLVDNAIYPVANLPQLAQATLHKDVLRKPFEEVPIAFQSVREGYDRGDADAFQSAMQSFVRSIRRVAEAVAEVRPLMTPPVNPYDAYDDALLRNAAIKDHPRCVELMGQVRQYEDAHREVPMELQAAVYQTVADLDPALARKVRESQEIHFNDAADILVWLKYKPLELNAKQIALSAYPPPGSTDVEILYNRAQPFAYAWIFFLVAAIVVSLSFMRSLEKPALLLGLFLAAGAIAYSTWGFALRVVIAGRPPVTNMYETVIWVAFFVAILGTWFSLVPLTWPGLRWSWRLSGPPLRIGGSTPGGVGLDRADAEDAGRLLARAMTPIQILATLVRLAGFAGIMWITAFSKTSFQIVSLLPPLGDAFSIGGLGTWFLGLTTSLLAAWYVPRAFLALVGSLATVVPEARREAATGLWDKLLARRYFLLPAMTVAFFGMMLAHFVGIHASEVLDPKIGSIAAVLRSNYWLTIHVLTIVSSYGAGALAWGLGNLAMLFYLVGAYRTEGRTAAVRDAESAAPRAAALDLDDSAFAGGTATAVAVKTVSASARTTRSYDVDETANARTLADADTVSARLKKAGQALSPALIRQTIRAGMKDFGSGDERQDESRGRPPKEVATLATYAYRTMQVAVLLLAAGTILGGLWADVSWGRFWDWDPKEVWALISLLAYLVVLHGRFAGWVGTFGTNVGSVLCFNAILMSWYGVNFVLPQIHGWLNGTGQATEVGLHSYATGAGGLGWVIGAVVLNLALVAFAFGRYAFETSDLFGGSKPDAPAT